MDNLVIVVTGSTGNVGRVLAERLLERGARVRAVARNVDGLSRLREHGAEVRAGSLEDGAFLDETLRGATRLFAMIPPNYTAPDFRGYQRQIAESLAGAIRRSAVRQVLSLSSIGAELASGNGPIGGLHDLEHRLDELPGVSAVHLRPTYFMENHLASIGLIQSAGINGSAIRGDLPLPMIAARDIGEVAADYLAGPEFPQGGVRYLLGPRDYTHVEATRILGASIGRAELQYRQFPPAQVHQALVESGLPDSLAGLIVEMQQAFNAGRVHGEPRIAENTTATSLEQFARDTFAPVYSRSANTGA
ncbi:MAG TPA: NmrA family NAD(P)-binding protein [Candidatus Polarisedimenticolaceae bacterium]|nr:NmrA family NAD(P)-binding protein [Candidatus Polarisedimenticolaceae bacterium]